MNGSGQIIVALDQPSSAAAMTLIERLGAGDYAVKVGKALFTREGPAIVRALNARGRPVFLDLKYHDIPTTVAAACRAAAELGVWMVNVHISGGSNMLRAARDALLACRPRPLLIGVTVLTSLNEADLDALGIAASAADQVLRLARLARDCALDGVVCSATEIAAVKRECGANFVTVTPAIRPLTASSDDQQRVATPADAVKAGGDYLVIGRPITHAGDPASALAAIADEIALARG